LSVDDIADNDHKKNRYYFDRHTPEYRLQFEKITEEMHSKCPVAWSETYDGHWVAAIDGGFISVANNQVSILCDRAEISHESDFEEAKRKLDASAPEKSDDEADDGRS